MGGGKGSNKTTSAFKLPPEFIKAYNESLGLARQAIQQPYTPYTGQLVAGLTPGQQQAIANIQASQGMALPFIQEGAGLTREAARGITPELYERFYSPYVRDVANATQANLLESAAQQRSGLKSGAIQAGAFGGDRGGIAQAEMARQQNLANAQAMANIYNQGYGQAMGLAGQQVQNLGAMGGQLAGMGTTAQNAVLQGAQAQLAAGAQEQATAQAQLQAAYDQFLQQQSYPFQIAQYFANIAQGLGSTAGGTSTTTAPGPNVGSQILGGLGAIANIAGSLPPSDKRVKENIEAVGTLNDGQTVYRYNFKGNPQTQIGLLAQEVEEVKPGSVVEVGGIKRVDYKGATDDAASSMGGVVGPGDDRQGFMNGGMPYGGVGFVPNNPMMVGASNKIPGAVMPTPDAGLAGASDMTQPFTDQQKQGVANIAGLFKKPSLYNAGGAVGRNAYADGGVPFMPYSGSRGWIPEGKLGGGGSSIPKAPDAYVDKGLSEDWQAIKPFTDEQRENLSLFPGKIRAMFADPEMAAAGYMDTPSAYDLASPGLDVSGVEPPTSYRFARGGVAGRGGYQIGGEPTMEEALAEAEALREPQGVAAAEAAPKRSSEFRLPSNKEVEAYIADAARKRGINPGIAIRVWRSEGATGNPAEAWQSKIINKRGEREKSYGPYQLYMEGGLGNEMQKATGLSPADPRNWQPSVDFALDKAAEGGWGPWMGAKAIGLAPDAGLGGARAVGQYAARGVGDLPAPSGYSDTQIMPVSAEAAPEGVAAAERDRTPFNLKNLFASDERPSIIESILGRRLSPEARAAALNASFALMAGRSPYFMTNLGEAGRVGAQTYYNAIQQKRAQEQQAAELAQQQYGAETNRMTAETARDKAIREQEQEATRQQMIEEAISKLPPDQQAAARLAPEEFFKAQAEAMFGTDDLPSLVEEYREAVKGGYTGTLEDWKKIGSSSDAKLGLQLVPLTDKDGNFIGYGQASSSGGIYYQGELVDGTNIRPMDPGLIAQERAAGAMAGAAPKVVIDLYTKTSRPEMSSISEGVAAMREAKKYLDKGIQTGSMSDALQALRGLAAQVGLNVDEEVLSNTQAYQNFIGNVVIPRMAALGGNDSNEELRRLYSLSGGDINQSLTALRNTIDFMDGLLERKFQSLKSVEDVALKYLPGVEPVPFAYGAPSEASEATEMPDFSKMTDEELEAYINEQQ